MGATFRIVAWAWAPILWIWKKQAQQTTAEQIENFKKAFSVSVEGENYLVRF